MQRTWLRLVSCLVASIVLIGSISQPSYGYAVLTHQAIIDYSWKSILRPHLKKRYPGLYDKQIEAARAYAYGGAIIQDMGYFPLSNSLYSDLTHYVRSGDFVEALIHDAKDLNEYAFALGALAHYCADTTGHPLMTNKAVAIYFPELQHKFGDSVTYEDDETAHSRAEYGFDVLKVAEHHYPSEAFHQEKGFKVARDLLDRAFKDTYGIPLHSVEKHERISIWFYCETVDELMPRLTKATWDSKRAEILALYPERTRDTHVVPKSKLKAEDHPLASNDRPNFFEEILGHLLTWFSGKKSFAKLDVMIPTKDGTEKLFLDAWTETHKCYKARIEDIDAGTLHLPNTNFDTGEPTKLGEYGLADNAYANLLGLLAKRNFQNIMPQLRLNILSFYAPGATPKNNNDPATWLRTKQRVQKLQQTNP
jgi:hypothetical protein